MNKNHKPYTPIIFKNFDGILEEFQMEKQKLLQNTFGFLQEFLKHSTAVCQSSRRQLNSSRIPIGIPITKADGFDSYLSTTNTDILCFRGWSGALHRFHLASRTWEWLACGPSPRAGHQGVSTRRYWNPAFSKSDLKFASWQK